MARNKNSTIESVIPQNIIPIDFKNMSKLPESHTWSEPNNDHSFTSISGSDVDVVVPVIDVNDSNAVLLMKKAFEEWGIFQVINHGISMELLQKMEDQTRKLFALPIEQKLKALRPNNDSGVNTGYGIAKISPFFQKLMWSEGFTIQGSLSEVTSKLWPQDSEASTTFCNVMNDYDEAITGLSQKILSMLITSLGLIDDDVKWYTPNTNSNSTERLLQLNSYPICPEPNKAMGLASHTDSSLLTLLYQSNTVGLQIYREQVGWINVEPINGAIVVNAGDLLQILSNGVFKSVLHRAVVNLTRHRISVALFLGPPKDVDISPPMKLVKHGEFPLYRPVTWKEYLNVKAKYFNESLDQIRFDPSKIGN